MGENPQESARYLSLLENAVFQCPIEIEISENAMKAYVRLPLLSLENPSKISTAESLDLAERLEKRIQEEARKKNVLFGFKNIISPLRGWIENSKPAVMELAQGQEPQHGVDSKTEIIFQKKSDYKSQTPGSKNLRELSFITNIPQKTLLARFTPATSGVAGKTVSLKEIPAKNGVEKPFKTNALIESLQEDSHIIYQTSQDCMLENLSPESISVTDHLKISSDIDYHTGNIDAWGSLTITGSVTPNFIVKATGDITISGNIESSYVEAKGSVKVLGIFGKTDSTIVKAGKNLEAHFLQNGYVSVGEDARVSDSVVNSALMAQGKIDVLGGKGAVVTSKLIAGAHIEAAVLGSSGESCVQVRAGVNPKLWQGLERQKRELNFSRRASLRGSYHNRKKDTVLERNIAIRQSKKRNFSAILERNISRREKRILADLVLKKVLPYVKATHKVYANVYIKIGPYHLKTTEESAGKTFQPDLQQAIIIAT